MASSNPQRPSPPELPGFRYDPVLNRYFALDRSRPTQTTAAAAVAPPPPFQISSTIRLDDHTCSFIRTLQYRQAGLTSPLVCRHCSHIRLMTPRLLRPVARWNEFAANQALALADDFVIAAGTNRMSRELSEINTVMLSDTEPLQFEPDEAQGVIGARSASIFTSLSIHDQYVMYSTLGNTDAGSVFIQHLSQPECAMQFSIPHKSVWSCVPVPSTDCLAIGCSRGGFILDTERRWRRPFGRKNIDVVSVHAESRWSLLCGSRSGYVDQIDLRSPLQICSNTRLDGSVSWLQSLGDARLLVATSNGDVVMLDRRMLRPVLSYIRNLKSGAMAPVRAHADLGNMRLFTHSSDRCLRCFDIGSGSLLHESQPTPYSASPMVWSPTHDALLIGCEDGIGAMQLRGDPPSDPL